MEISLKLSPYYRFYYVELIVQNLQLGPWFSPRMWDVVSNGPAKQFGPLCVHWEKPE